MTDHENAIGVMKDLFGRDYQFALSTAKKQHTVLGLAGVVPE